MKIIPSSRIRPYLKRLSIFLITVALVVGMAGCDGGCGALSTLQYALSIFSTLGGRTTPGGEVTFTYNEGTVVDIVATPDADYQFVEWTGDVDTVADVYADETTIIMNDDYSITANFEQIPPEQFTLTISSTAGGSVTTPGEGNFAYDEGYPVNLAAKADEGYQFINWTGDVNTISDVNAATTTITMNGDYSITANFEQIPPEQLTLTISSTTGGSVSTPGEGNFAYDEGAAVNLTAKADEGYQFLNWTGDVSTIPDVNAATTTITMNDDYSITANFVAVYELTISSTDGGEVITPGEGTFTYDAGTVVSLVAEAGESYHFTQWTGNVSTIADVNAATTTITMNGDYSITAIFALPIWDWYDLDAIRDNLGGSYILMNDLDSTTAGYTELASETANGGKGWQPIGTTSKNAKFAGSFDGQGHEICDLFIDRPAKSNMGLFGVVSWGGVIENVSLMNATVTGYSGVGGLVGWNRGTMSNSYCTGRVTGGWRVGGLAGHNSGTVSNSYCTGRVTGGWWVGGLAGHNSGTVSNSYCTGIVTGGWWVGGLAGYNSDNVSNSYCTGRVTGYGGVGGLVGWNSGTVTDSYSSGSVTGNKRVGGLAGHNSGTVSNSYCTGIVTGYSGVGGLLGWNEGSVTDSYSSGSVTGNKRVGGLVGWNSGTVSNSFWDTQTSGQANSAGGTGKTTAEMQEIATFTGAAWDITDVDPGETNPAYTWNIVDTVTYPFLGWQPV